MRLGLRLNDLGIGDRPETYPRSTYPKRMEGALQGKKESGRNNPSFLNHHVTTYSALSRKQQNSGGGGCRGIPYS